MIFSKFFSNLQNAPWYREFLNPVINEIRTNSKLLDIGTGSGKLLEILAIEKNVECIGVDTNINMLKEAEKKLIKTNVKLIKVDADQNFPFDNTEFDNITICSVLFHMSTDNIDTMLTNAQRVLKKNGKIIILTPTGKGDLVNLSKGFFSWSNISIYIWFLATRNRAKLWIRNSYIQQYASTHQLNYKSQIVMNGFAIIEILNK